MHSPNTGAISQHRWPTQASFVWGAGKIPAPHLPIPNSIDAFMEITGQNALEPSNAEMLDWRG